MDNDEKVPTVLECRPKDDGDGTSNVDDDSKETETAIDENVTSENVKSDLKELESDLDSVSDLGITNEPPNHVDHLPSDKEGCVQNSLSSETDNIVPLGNEESSTVEQGTLMPGSHLANTVEQ